LKFQFIVCIFLFINISNFNLYAANYAFVNVLYLFENNSEYKNFLDKLKIKENEIKIILKADEEKLVNLKNEIDTSSLILNENELKDKIQIYNEQLAKFENKINENNIIIENYLLDAKKLFFLKVNNLLIEISKENNYDFILDQNNILLVNDELNISEKVSSLLNQTSIGLEEILN